MKKALLTLIILICSLSVFPTSLSFSGGRSSLSLREGKEEVVLSEGAVITLDDMTIKSEKITLSGTDWRYVNSEGSTYITDEKNGLDIKAVGLWFDREREYLSIESWFEIQDTENELSAMGGSMYFDMKNEVLELKQQVTLTKITDDSVMRCSAESVVYDRQNQTLTLSSNARVTLDLDQYRAEMISINLDTNEIKLEGRIEGSING